MEKRPVHNLTRRDFIKAAAGMIGGMIGVGIGLPLIDYLLSPGLRDQGQQAWILLGLIEEIPVGVPTPFRFTRTTINGWEKTATSHGVFVVRIDPEQVRVLSNVCTHLGCIVSWKPEQQEYVSPCHNGHFDMIGNVTYGPPPRPLDEYETRIENGNLFVLFPPYQRINA